LQAPSTRRAVSYLILDASCEKVRLDHVIQSQTVAVGNSLIESRLSSAYQLLYRAAASPHTASKISLLGAVQLVVFVMSMWTTPRPMKDKARRRPESWARS
jgi:hypothetical protein